MLKENGREKSTINTEVSSTIKLKQVRNMMCSNCGKASSVEVAVFGEEVCPLCGSSLHEVVGD